MRRRPSLRVIVAVVVAIAAGATPACAPDVSSVGAVFDAAPGLTAEYFDGLSFQQPSGVYRDGNIDFEGWALNDRIQSRGHVAQSVSIRWTGQIWFERAESHTLSFELEGRVRLWIDDSPIIDDWVDSGLHREARGTVPAAEAGWRDLRIEWDQRVGAMTARLSAASASAREAIVPARALRHLTGDDAALAADLPLSSVTGQALSPHGLIVGGVSSEAELFWDAWVVPLDGAAPRRLAPIGDALISVDASGALWTTITSEDETGRAAYEVRLSPADGTPSVLLSPDLPATFSADRAVTDGDGGRLLVGCERLADGTHASVFAVDAHGRARQLARDPRADSPLVLDATLAPDALQVSVQYAADDPVTILTIPRR